MSQDKLFELAMRMMSLGVSKVITSQLLGTYPLEQIERQLDWLPLRNAKRPEAFLVEAIRKEYSPPRVSLGTKGDVTDTTD